VEQKKRLLEENVDALNEELVKISAQGGPGVTIGVNTERAWIIRMHPKLIEANAMPT